MAFKLKPPFNINQSPVYERELEEGCLGKGNKNGTILVSDKITDDQEQVQSIIEHEEVHIDQVKRGDLDYDEKNVYWKGKAYSRSKMKEGNPNLPWEKEAYSKTDPYEKY
jgi:hypothetical protein|tara:strand:- start:119 stop:448 length:330 start_codon:yes stop_codon:yes gene_type:complete